MTNETEVLRISGNVTVPKRANNLAHLFEKFLKDWGYTWSGSIVPQDDESGMRLYVVAEVELYKQWIKDLQAVIEKHKLTEIENDKLTLSLSEELDKERENSDIVQKKLDREQDRGMYWYEQFMIANKRLESKENNRWRTFIKWWKKLWD